jgi:hypothetical protein
MRIDNAFCMSMGGNSDRSSVCWEERNICIEGVFTVRAKFCPFLMEGSNVAILSTGCQLVTSESSVTSVSLCCWQIGQSVVTCKQVSIGEWEVHVSEPLNNLHPLHHGPFHRWPTE